MRLLFAVAAATLFAAVTSNNNNNADVFPSCGKREPHIATAGEACGGPFVCSGGNTVCVTLDNSVKMPGYETAYICSKICASDADCAGLAMPMVCTGKGRVGNDYSKPTERLCIPTKANAGPKDGGGYF